jgi:hypothetical protein
MTAISRLTRISLLLPVCLLLAAHPTIGAGGFEADDAQRRQYDAVAPKTIIELQPFRATQKLILPGAGGRQLTATLIDLNPNIHVWYLLTLDWGNTQPSSYHLENPNAAGQTLHLSRDRLIVSSPDKTDICDLALTGDSALEQARTTTLPYAPLCNGLIYLRNPVAGHQTRLEQVTDFLRDHIWKGDAIVGFVRGSIYRDKFREAANASPITQPPQNMPVQSGPLPASLSSSAKGLALASTDLGVDLAGAAQGQLETGHWYAARNVPGVYVSAIEPRAVSDEILNRNPKAMARPDSVEASALDYLVAFDLSQFHLEFALGTDHPRLGWSARVSGSVRNDNLPGPDGIVDAGPLVRTGMIDPVLTNRVAATFTGGFKREHGGFKYGELATRNGGSHYGFIEQGVIFSKLQPGLATLYASDDGAVQMKTWSEEDNLVLGHIRFARQNGVPLVEPDPATGVPVPGRLVSNWGAGNWSGSADEKLRTLRAGACLQESGNQHFLVYGWFSTATPPAMSAVFLAYHCRYAMLLDINALEHTYLAVYGRQGNKFSVEHLVTGMSELDRVANGEFEPRFLAFPDNRDFFYLTRKRSGS